VHTTMTYPISSNYIPILHKLCGNTAFYYRHLPVPGEIIEASKALLVDGTKPVRQEPMICGGCKQQIDIIDLKV